MTSTNADDVSREITGGPVKLAIVAPGCVGLPLSVEPAPGSSNTSRDVTSGGGAERAAGSSNTQKL